MQLYSSECSWGDVLPRYSFLEPFITGKRILEIGSGDGSGVMFLHQCGAAEVLGVEREGPLLQSALERANVQEVSFRSFDGSRIEAPTGAYDLVVGFNLAAKNEKDLITEIQRVLHPTGYLMVTIWNPLSVSWARQKGEVQFDKLEFNLEEILSYLQAFFPRLTVIGQKPFMGYAIGRMGVSTDEVAFEMDNLLVDDKEEQAAFFLVACGRKPLRTDRHSLVQLPTREVIHKAMAPQAETDLQVEQLQIHLQMEQDEKLHVQEELRRLREEKDGLEQQVVDQKERIANLRGELEQSHQQIQKLDKSVKAHFEEATNALARADDDREELASIRSKNQQLKKSVEQLSEKVELLKAKEGAWETERLAAIEMQKESDTLRQELERSRRELENAYRERDEHRDQTGSFQEELSVVVGEREQLEKDNQAAKERIRTLQKELEQFSAQEVTWNQKQSDYKARLLDREKETTALQQRLDQEAGKVVELQKTLSEQNQRYQDLESDLLDVANRLDEAKEEEQKNLKKTVELQSRLESRNEELDESLEKIDTLTREHLGAQRMKQELTATIEGLRRTLQDHERIEKEYQESRTKLEQEGIQNEKRLQERIDQAKEEITSREEELERTLHNLDESRQVVDELKAEIAQLERSLGDAEQKLQSAEEHRLEAQALASRVQEIEEFSKEEQKRKQELEHSLAHARDELNEERDKARTAMEELERLREECGKQQQTTEQERQQVTQREHELKEQLSSVSQQLKLARKEATQHSAQVEELNQKLALLESRAILPEGGVEKDAVSDRILQEKDKRIKHLESQVVERTKQIHTLMAKLSQVTGQGKAKDLGERA